MGQWGSRSEAETTSSVLRDQQFLSSAGCTSLQKPLSTTCLPCPLNQTDYDALYALGVITCPPVTFDAEQKKMVFTFARNTMVYASLRENIRILEVPVEAQLSAEDEMVISQQRTWFLVDLLQKGKVVAKVQWTSWTTYHLYYAGQVRENLIPDTCSIELLKQEQWICADKVTQSTTDRAFLVSPQTDPELNLYIFLGNRYLNAHRTDQRQIVLDWYAHHMHRLKSMHPGDARYFDIPVLTSTYNLGSNKEREKEHSKSKGHYFLPVPDGLFQFMEPKEGKKRKAVSFKE